MIRAVKAILRGGLRAAGYDVVRCRYTNLDHPKVGYDLEDAFRACLPIISNHTMLSYARAVTLFQQVVHCEAKGIPGAYVECGVWRGGAVGLMALANQRYGKCRRHLHLFDSFRGIPEPSEIDGIKAKQQAESVGATAQGRLIPMERTYAEEGTLEVNRALLEQSIGYDPAFLHYHEGWFQDTVPIASATIGEIAILRLDGDWYESTKVCLEHLFEKVTSGGFVVIDDYGCYEGCKKAVDEFLEAYDSREFLNHIDAVGRYLIRQ